MRRNNNSVSFCGRIAMWRAVLIVGLLLSLLPNARAQDEPAPATALTLQEALDLIRSALASVEASTADLETTRQTVIFNTKQAYYGLLSSQRLLQVAQETVRQNQQHLEEAEARVEVGIAPQFDVTQAQVHVSNAELDLVTARNNVALGRETLRTALGTTGPFEFTLVDTLERRQVSLNDEDILTQAYAKR